MKIQISDKRIRHCEYGLVLHIAVFGIFFLFACILVKFDIASCLLMLTVLVPVLVFNYFVHHDLVTVVGGENSILITKGNEELEIKYTEISEIVIPGYIYPIELILKSGEIYKFQPTRSSYFKWDQDSKELTFLKNKIQPVAGGDATR